MPNKRNPDVIELMRATHASVAAARTEIEQLLSLPSGYHRDLQSSKGAIFHGFGRGLAALELLPALLANLEWRDDKLRAAIDSACMPPTLRWKRRWLACRSARPTRPQLPVPTVQGRGVPRKAASPRACRRVRPPTCARRTARALAGAVLMAGTVYLVMAMRRPDFNDAAVQPHRDFLDALQAQGKLQLTGGFADGSGGAYVLCNVDSPAQAQAIVATDPLVTMHASDLTVHEWNTR